MYNNQLYYSILALAIVLANYLSELLNCNVKKFIKDNILFKHLILILLIILTIEFNNTDSQFHLEDFHKKLFIIGKTYLGVLLIFKLNIYYFVPFILLFLCQYFLKLHIEKSHSYSQNREQLNNVKQILDYIIYTIVGIGNIHYFAKQYNEHKNFNIIKYIFGTIQCKK